MKKIKVGFSGTHGTGKTTKAYQVATVLKEQNFDASVVTEVARKCPYPINEGATLQSQMWIFTEMLKEEIMSKSQITICDRTLLDVYAYTKRINEKRADAMLPFILDWYKTYDVMFFTEINPSYKLKDGIRSTDKKFQKEIDDIIYDIRTEYKLVYDSPSYKRNYVEIIKEALEE